MHRKIPALPGGPGALQFISQQQYSTAAARDCCGDVWCLFPLSPLARKQGAGNIRAAMAGVCLCSSSDTPRYPLGQRNTPTFPGMRFGAKESFPLTREPRSEAALSSSCCQLTGQAESCYCKDSDHTEPHACPCRKVPRGHLSDTKPVSGAGAKGSPPGAVWLGSPALNCRVQSCSWSEAISSEALGRVYIPGMSIPILGSMEQRQ